MLPQSLLQDWVLKCLIRDLCLLACQLMIQQGWRSCPLQLLRTGVELQMSQKMFAGIPNSELRLDAHALAGLYSCKIRTFSGYIQSLNPNLT